MRNKLDFLPITGAVLDRHLRSIGFNMATEGGVRDANVEETLVSASIEAVNKKDNRIGALLIDWFTTHYPRLNVDRLTRLVFSLDKNEFEFVKIFWCANAQRVFKKDSRFRRLSEAYKGKRIDFIDRFAKNKAERVTKMFIEMRGEDTRFKGTCIRVPIKHYSHRPEQIFPASVIAKTHMPFRYRIMIGASYRADVWAILRRYPSLSGYELGRRAHCSKTIATKIRNDYRIIKRDYSGAGSW